MTETWTYVDASTIEIAGDVTARYWPNLIAAVTQTTQKFFVISAVNLVSGNTRLTVNGCGVYTLANAAIAAHAVTANDAIQGLPNGFGRIRHNKYGCIPLPGDTRRGLAAFWNESIGDVYGVEQVSYSQSGLNTPMTRIFSAPGTTIGFGHYTDLTTFVHLMRILPGGDVIIGSGDPIARLDVRYPLNTRGIAITCNGYDDDYLNAAITFHSLVDVDLQGDIVLYHDGTPTHPGIWFWGYPANPFGCYSGPHIGTDGSLSVGDAVNCGWGNLHVYGNGSFDSITDRTPGFTGDALNEIRKIKSLGSGQIDHDSLPAFVRVEHEVPVYEIREVERDVPVLDDDEKTKGVTERKKVIERIQVGTKTQQGRNIGNMVSVLTKGVQELLAMIEDRDTKIVALTARLKKLEDGFNMGARI